MRNQRLALQQRGRVLFLPLDLVGRHLEQRIGRERVIGKVELFLRLHELRRFHAALTGERDHRVLLVLDLRDDGFFLVLDIVRRRRGGDGVEVLRQQLVALLLDCFAELPRDLLAALVEIGLRRRFERGGVGRILLMQLSEVLRDVVRVLRERPDLDGILIGLARLAENQRRRGRVLHRDRAVGVARDLLLHQVVGRLLFGEVRRHVHEIVSDLADGAGAVVRGLFNRARRDRRCWRGRGDDLAAYRGEIDHQPSPGMPLASAPATPAAAEIFPDSSASDDACR